MSTPFDDRNEMREIFFESAAELLQALNDLALQLESKPGDAEVLRAIRRSVHTLKGDSAAMGFTELCELAHELEDVLAPELATDAARLSAVLLSAADMFDAMVAAYQAGLEIPNGDPLRAMIWKLAQAPAAPVAPKPPSPGRDSQSACLQPKFAWSEYEQLAIAEAVRRGDEVFDVAIAFARECPMREAGAELIAKALSDNGEILACSPDRQSWPAAEIIELSFASAKRNPELSQLLSIPGVVGEVLVRASGTEPAVPAGEPVEQKTSRPAPSDNVLRVDVERVDAILGYVSELVTAKSVLHQVISEFAKAHPRDPLRVKLQDALAFQTQVLNGLQRAAMKVRMVPVEQLFRRFPRLVHDVALQCGKSVSLVTEGQDTDLDKALLDAVAEPLAHLVRNAIDHGIETAEERRAAGKPEQGTLRLNAFHRGNQVVIELSDDGRGIDSSRILACAVQRGMISAEQAERLAPEDVLDFIFEPGFSTATQVTEISGRGVGMDVVKAAVQKLKGSIKIETEPGRATKLQLRLPLTLAILRAMLFRVNEQLYAVPLDSVSEIRRAQESEITRAGSREVIQFRDELLTVVRLRRMDAAQSVFQTGRLFVLVVEAGQRKFGVVVDSIVGEDELVIKPLDANLVASDLVSGASVLGDGSVALILNLDEALRRYATAAAPMPLPAQTMSAGARV